MPAIFSEFLKSQFIILYFCQAGDQEYVRDWPGIPLVHHLYLRIYVCYC